ncbi:MAG: universal stress protein [Pyrinomonadaceae bacterium]
MMTIKRILCPTDLTRNSDQALDYALALARAYESRLIICYCTDGSENVGAIPQIPAEAVKQSELAYAFSQVRTQELLKGGPLSFLPGALPSSIVERF